MLAEDLRVLVDREIKRLRFSPQELKAVLSDSAG